MRQNNPTQKLNNFLYCGIFDRRSNRKAAIRRIQGLRRTNTPIKILYGETYDELGVTIDSLKYYFVLHVLHQLLEEAGCEVETSVIIGDVAATHNDSVADKEYLMKLGSTRMDFISKVINSFSLRINPVLMSDLLQDEQIQQQISRCQKIYEKSSKLRSQLAKSVLKNRLNEERKKGFYYALEEVSIILNYDLKIGPPREKVYDRAAGIVAVELEQKAPLGLYLKPTYPLGLNFDYFVNNPEIEKFGLTPYKAGSNKLQRNRIILGETEPHDIEKLVAEAFSPQDAGLPDPILDLYIIGDLARRLSLNDQDLNFNEKFTKFKGYSRDAIDLVDKYILKKLA